MSENILCVKNIKKSFGGVHALKGVDLTIKKGETHCLAGENGCGKSTIIKVISGFYKPDEGTIEIDGKEYTNMSTADAIAAGIQVIYQDFSIFPNLTVMENLAFNQVLAEKKKFVNKREFRKIAEEAVKKINFDVDLDARVETLPVADKQLIAISRALLHNARLFHFGTLSMTDDNVKEATKRAIETAKNNGLIISFDPNLRPPLWKSLDDARNQIAYGLSQCDVLKISDNEIEFMTGTSDFDKGANILMERYPNIKLLNITAGADGSYSYYREIRAYVPSYLLGGTIDTTGAGDTFCGSVLNYLLDHDLENLSKENLIEMLQIANAAAYLVTTKKGAIRSMPDPKDVQKVVNNNYIRED